MIDDFDPITLWVGPLFLLHKVSQCLICVGKELDREVGTVSKVCPQSCEASRETGESHGTIGMCKGTKEESLFPLDDRIG